MFFLRIPGVYQHPWLAVTLALVGLGASVALSGVAADASLSGIALTILIAVATTLPLLAAGVLIPIATASVKFARAVGIARPRLNEVAIGVCAGLVVRALTEMLSPTTGTVSNPLGGGIAPAVVLSLVVAVAVSPFVEELLFRGVLQRALADGIEASRAAVAAGVAIAVTTAIFVLAHVVTSGLQIGVLVSTITVGVACGVLSATTGRLTAAVAAHSVHNAIGVALLVW